VCRMREVSLMWVCHRWIEGLMVGGGGWTMKVRAAREVVVGARE